jgi:dienelactone hydrolase
MIPPEERGAEREVHVRLPELTLAATLAIPADARGLVIFAHGSGSSRHSTRNRFVAEQLREGGLATLLLDLLSREEELEDLRTRHLRFDISMLGERVRAAVDWTAAQPALSERSMGLFGASTGAAAALVAAAERPARVGAVVSRGGRPDLAASALPRVSAPTLLIVGGNDKPVIGMNQDAMARMTSAETHLEIVPGATHLFEEPGKLRIVSDLARDWFLRHLGGEPPMLEG